MSKYSILDEILRDDPLELPSWTQHIPFFNFQTHSQTPVEIRLYPDDGCFLAMRHRIRHVYTNAAGWESSNNADFYCPDFDPKTGKSIPRCCPLCLNTIPNLYCPGQIMYQVNGFVWVPRKRGRGKWTGPQPIRFPMTVASRIKAIVGKVGKEPDDEDDGYTLIITYDHRKKGSAMWSCEKGSFAPIWFLDPQWEKKKVCDFEHSYKPGKVKRLKRYLGAVGI